MFTKILQAIRDGSIGTPAEQKNLNENRIQEYGTHRS